ncbi:MAG: FAD:protein FMN transferase [Calditrichaeota bacterium]|nr:FAD:protein FMN transferase [Calditrichota bacterium]MCB9368109.1 FAD:protein FMN transferase [Calditrichota bacterium]
MRHFVTISLFAALILAVGCKKAEENFPSETRTVFGVPVTVSIFMKDAKPENLKPAFDAAFSMLGAYEKTTVAPGPENQLEKIAGGAGKESVPVDTTVYAMLMRALQLNDMTGEAFDLRYGPLLDAWLASGKPVKPSQADLDSALSLIKTGGMFVAGKAILLSKPMMRFDARGYADAWAIDRAAEKLNQMGFNAFEIRTPYAVRVVGMPMNQQNVEVMLSSGQPGDSAWACVSMGQGGLAYLPAEARDANGYRLVVDPRTGDLPDGGMVAMAKDCATAYALAYAMLVDGDGSKLDDKGKAELMGSVRVSGSKPNYSLAAEGSLKDRIKTLN